jgi:predicted RNA-binding protein YlqC (UPF0109 family)
MGESLKQLGQIQVTDWDFVGLLNTDIRELEVRKHLKELGKVRVMEWDFRTVLPVIREKANQEVDVAGFFKRAAQIKVIEWDFRNSLAPATQSKARKSPALDKPEIRALVARLENFLQYTAANLIDNPDHARIEVSEIAPAVLRFKLILVKRDVSLLVGREGHTASAIRNILKASTAAHGVHALLDIHSHEDEARMLAKQGEASWLPQRT